MAEKYVYEKGGHQQSRYEARIKNEFIEVFTQGLWNKCKQLEKEGFDARVGTLAEGIEQHHDERY